MKKERRDFLKLTAFGVTGAALVRGNRAFAAWPASGTMEINPAISNMRVVGLVDAAMIPTAPATMTLATQSSALDVARVNANMDAMAMALAGKCTPDEAWKTIFRSSKPWASTVVAIKINTAEAKNTARIAVVDKLCKVLNGFGVPAANIFLYDRGGINAYASYCSKTDATKIPAVVDTSGMGSLVDVPLPDGTTAPCAKKIADGSVDILINIPTNKGHSAFGGATLSCKNHFGTFAPNHFCPPSDAGQFCSNPDTTKFYNYVFNISKSDAIIGGTPARQQLCVVDSLFANKVENMGTPEAMPCYLVMGTFGPAVDYLTIKKIREEVMGAKHTASLVSQYMTQYGYTTADPQWILVPPSGSGADAGACNGGGTGGAGGSSAGTGGSGSGGDKGTGGAGSGGDRATGGAGGRDAGSGVGSGGAKGTGGASGSGGSSMVGTGGAKGTGGAGAGGTTSTGGSGGASGNGGSSVAASGGRGGNAGSGGAPSSGGSGGASASGGASGTGNDNPTSGCGCDIGGAPSSLGGLGVGLAVLAAGQLRRLLLRRDTVAERRDREDTDSSSLPPSTDDKS